MQPRTVSNVHRRQRVDTLYRKTKKNEQKFDKLILDMESEREQAIYCKRGKRKIELLRHNEGKLYKN